MSNQLSVTRAKDREAMATAILALANDQWTCEREEMGPREVWVSLEGPRGLRVTVTLDADDKQDRAGQFCLAWNIGTRSDAELSDAFGRYNSASVNPYHHAKCTAFVQGFPHLLEKLAGCMALAISGEAFRN